MAEAELRVPISEASPEQLLRAIYRQNVEMEKRMSELTQAVTQLQGAVDGVAQRLLPQIVALEEANSTLRSSLESALADDEAAAAAFAEAEAAAQAIRAQVEELNTLGAAPQTPIEDVPAEETAPAVPVEVPAEEPATEPTPEGAAPTADEGGATTDEGAEPTVEPVSEEEAAPETAATDVPEEGDVVEGEDAPVAPVEGTDEETTPGEPAPTA